MTEAQIWLTAARNAIDELLANDAANRMPELIDRTKIPAQSKALFESIDDLLSVQHERTLDDLQATP